MVEETSDSTSLNVEDAQQLENKPSQIHENAESNGFPARLKSAIRDKSIRAFARECGLSDTVLRQYLNGQSEPTRPALIALARTANVSFTWLACGEGSQEEASHLLLDKYHLPHFPHLDDDLVFAKKWLKQEFPKASEGLMQVRMFDDSMDPTIKLGDIVLVDVNDGSTTFLNHGIYMLNIFSSHMIKRLQRVGPGQLRVISDNSVYESFTIQTEDFRREILLMGRVIWYGRKLITEA